MAERRRQRRDMITVPANFSASFTGGSEDARLPCGNGITLNVSGAGLCLYTPLPLEEGLSVEVSSQAIRLGPRKGAVRWCRKITEDLYRVGIVFR
jgi:hypothetical protein